MTDKTVPALASSTLFFMFADRYVPAPHFPAQATRCPCTGVKVQTDKLASLLLAFAFWSLREEGAIRLSLDGRKTWVFHHTHVVVDAIARVERPGLEGVLADAIALSTHEDVCDIVCSALGENEDPYNDVVRATGTEGIDCRELDRLEERFQALSLAWDHFRRGEPDLYDGLLRQCAKGMRSCVEVFEP